MRKTSVERLVELLRSGGILVAAQYEFRRCRPGHWGLSAGAWSWYLTWTTAGGAIAIIGSPDAVGQILRMAGANHAKPGWQTGENDTIYAND